MAEENNFKLSRSEFANKQGISVDNLKKRMKRGHYQNSYVFHNGKYLFSTREAVRPNKVNSPGTNVPRKGTVAIILKANILMLPSNKRTK